MKLVFKEAISLDGTVCPNQCSKHGVCNNKVCFCADGYTGDDCSAGANSLSLKYGEPIPLVVKYGIACLIIGMVVGKIRQQK
jgi:hypothetical protein